MFKMSETVFRSLHDEDGGACVKCQTVAYGVEPDARMYICEECGRRGVYGIDELLIMGLVEIIEEGEDGNIKY